MVGLGGDAGSGEAGEVVRGLDGGEDGFKGLEVRTSTMGAMLSMAVCMSTTGGAVCAKLDNGVVPPAGVLPVLSQMMTALAGCLKLAMEASVLRPFAFLTLLRVVRGLAKDGVQDDSVLLSLGVMCQSEKKNFHRVVDVKKKVEACPIVGEQATLERQIRENTTITHF
jgi:hypothetical protein